MQAFSVQVHLPTRLNLLVNLQLNAAAHLHDQHHTKVVIKSVRLQAYVHNTHGCLRTAGRKLGISYHAHTAQAPADSLSTSSQLQTQRCSGMPGELPPGAWHMLLRTA